MQDYDFDLQSIQAVRDLARKGKIAANQLAHYDEEQIDRILRNMVKVAEENAQVLASMAVEETGFGKVCDKVYKNHIASALLYEEIRDKKTIGVIDADEKNQVISIAEPVGLLMGIVPSTNPTSTVIYKAMIALKARNAIVFSPHPAAAKCTGMAIQLMNQAAVEAGAPENVIQGITPAYIERSANVHDAVRRILASKTFDYGTICASEQSIICETCNRDAVMAEFRAQGGYFMTEEECKKVCALLFRNGHSMSPKFVGHSPQSIAQAAGITIPEGTRVLIGEQHGVGDAWPLSYEKLTTVLGFYTVSNWEEACELSIELLQNGIGHTMSIHTTDKDMVRKFSVKPASRILVNTGGSQGGTGVITGLDVALTLGCGTWGGSSVSENVGPQHLINVKRVVNGLIEPDEVVAHDELFAKWHPDLAAHHTEAATPVAGCCDAVSATGCCDSKPHPVSGISYSVGCNCTDVSPDALAAAKPNDVIDADELQKMIHELTNAFKGI